MKQTTRAVFAAVAVLSLSSAAFAQSNNSLARPSVTSPVAPPKAPQSQPANTGVVGDPSSPQPDNATHGSTPLANPQNSHNTLATPTTKSPAAGQ